MIQHAALQAYMPLQLTFPVFSHIQFKLIWNAVQFMYISDFTAQSTVYFPFYDSYTEIKRDTVAGSGSSHS